MTESVFHVEAKLHAFRKTQEGVVVAFVLHPQEVPSQLALDPLGTRYMLALAEIADDETPVRDPATVPESRPAPETGPLTPAPNSPGPGAHPKDFVRSVAGKQRYAEADDMKQAVMRAAVLAVDHEFQAWASRYSSSLASVDAAAQFIRRRCAIDSRKEIGVNERAYQAFRSLETEYDIARSRLPEPRG